MTLINKPLLFLRMETIKMKQTVRLKKLREGAIIPAYGTEFAAVPTSMHAWIKI